MEKGGLLFGALPEFSARIGSANAGSAFPINSREMIGTTLKELVRFEGPTVKETLKGPFACACAIGDTDLIAVHTHRGSRLMILRVYELGRPLCECDSGANGVFHLLFSPKTKSLIAVGSGVVVFEISYSRLRTSCPDVSVRLRSRFAPKYDSSLLSPPCFDWNNELIFLPTSDGVRAFDLDGHEGSLRTKLPATDCTVFTFSCGTGKMLSNDPDNGLCLWRKNGALAGRFGIAGGSILAMAFVDAENVVFVNAYGSVYAMNVKTGRPFVCCQVDGQPTRFTFYTQAGHPKIGVCIGGLFQQLDVVLPWRAWALNVYRAKAMKRCNKENGPARILAESESSYVKLFSPKARKLLTSATSRNPSKLFSVLYDRGVVMVSKRVGDSYIEEPVFLNSEHDQVILVTDDGTLMRYNAKSVPCEEQGRVDVRAKSVEIVCHLGEWMFAVATIDGYLVLYDYETWDERVRFNLGKLGSIGVKYVHEIHACLVVFNGKIGILDINTGHFTDWLTKDVPSAYEVCGTFLVMGFDDGGVAMYEINGGKFETVETDAVPDPHKERVTGFAFTQETWLSCSVDCSVLVWDYKYSIVSRIELPFPVYSIAILNGKREVLVAMENEIMAIQGRAVFQGVDEEDKRIDNYDLLDDVLNPKICAAQRLSSDIAADQVYSKRKPAPPKKPTKITVKARLVRQSIAQVQEQKKEAANEPGEDEEAKERKIREMKSILEEPHTPIRERVPESTNEGTEEVEKTNQSDGDQDSETKEAEEIQSEPKKKHIPKSAGEFLKEAKEADAVHEKRKRRQKPKASSGNELEQPVTPEPVDLEQSKNLLQMLDSKMRSQSPKPRKENEGQRRKIETDITKMSFVACTTSVTEPESDSENAASDTEEVEEEVTKTKSNRKRKERKIQEHNETKPKKTKEAAQSSTKKPKKAQRTKPAPEQKQERIRTPRRRSRRVEQESSDESTEESDDDVPVEHQTKEIPPEKPKTTKKSNRRKKTEPRREYVLSTQNEPLIKNEIPAKQVNRGTQPISEPRRKINPKPSHPPSQAPDDSVDERSVESLEQAKALWMDRELTRPQTPPPQSPRGADIPPAPTKRANTPEMKPFRRYFGTQNPSVVFDTSSLVRLYKRGHTELMPAIKRHMLEGKISPDALPFRLSLDYQLDGSDRSVVITTLKTPEKTKNKRSTPARPLYYAGGGALTPSGDRYRPKQFDVHVTSPKPVVRDAAAPTVTPITSPETPSEAPSETPPRPSPKARLAKTYNPSCNSPLLPRVPEPPPVENKGPPVVFHRPSPIRKPEPPSPVFFATPDPPKPPTISPAKSSDIAPPSPPITVQEEDLQPLYLTGPIKIVLPQALSTPVKRPATQRSADARRKRGPRKLAPTLSRPSSEKLNNRKRKNTNKDHPKPDPLRKTRTIDIDDDDDDDSLTGCSSIYASLSGSSMMKVQASPKNTFSQTLNPRRTQKIFPF